MGVSAQNWAIMSEPEPPFSVELHRRTKDVHDASDKLINLKLIVALTDSRIYGSVLKDFYFVYRAIEEALDSCRDSEFIFPLRDPRMYRAAALEQDVAFFLGDDWADHEEPSPATKKYLSRIDYVKATNPVMLFAYAHSMFLASLAGGQILGAIIKRTLGLSGDDGLAFFDYGDIDTKALRSEFKERVNALEIDRPTKEEIIVEKKLVFKLNNEIASQVQLSLSGFSRLLKLFLLVVLVIAMLIFMMKLIW